jgi:hypothetical protein
MTSRGEPANQRAANAEIDGIDGRQRLSELPETGIAEILDSPIVASHDGVPSRRRLRIDAPPL